MTTNGHYNIAAELSVDDGKDQEVAAISARLRQHADGSCAAKLEVALSDDHRRLTLQASAGEEEDIRQLLLRIGPDLEQLDAHARVTEVHCAGDVSAALRKALTRFNTTFH